MPAAYLCSVWELHGKEPNSVDGHINHKMQLHQEYRNIQPVRVELCQWINAFYPTSATMPELHAISHAVGKSISTEFKRPRFEHYTL